MRAFKENAELRLSREDLKILLCDALNEHEISDRHKVVDISLHPKYKYVIRVTMTRIKRTA